MKLKLKLKLKFVQNVTSYKKTKGRKNTKQIRQKIQNLRLSGLNERTPRGRNDKLSPTAHALDDEM